MPYEYEFRTSVLGGVEDVGEVYSVIPSADQRAPSNDFLQDSARRPPEIEKTVQRLLSLGFDKAASESK